MNFDTKLIKTAERILKKHFPKSAGKSCAMYSKNGSIYTGVQIQPESESAFIDPEVGPICQAYMKREIISASVTVGWGGPGTKVLVYSPCGLSFERMIPVIDSETEIAVHDIWHPETPLIKRAKDFAPYHWANTKERGNFSPNGMGKIGKLLKSISNKEGVLFSKKFFKDRFVSNLREVPLKTFEKRSEFNLMPRDDFYNPKFYDSTEFLRPRNLNSVTLRQIAIVFELTVDEALHEFINKIRDKLNELNCNEADINHILRGGREPLVHTFSNLLIFLEKGQLIKNECPFQPFESEVLDKGVPMHKYISRSVSATSKKPDNKELLESLISILESGEKGGFIPYLHQRGLFTLPMFEDRTYSCPFSSLATEIFEQTASGLEDGLNNGLIHF